MSLSKTELKAWLRYVSGMSSLMQALDQQLRIDSDLSLDDFGILSRLSSSPESSLRMADLAAQISYSPSRLSHAITRMAKLGWVERDRDPGDGRGVLARLTPAGDHTLREAWPAHASLIRKLVIDVLTPTELAEMESTFGKIDRAAVEHDESSGESS
jgi:DNA-binding MarR family transcriptional regulator